MRKGHVQVVVVLALAILVFAASSASAGDRWKLGGIYERHSFDVHTTRGQAIGGSLIRSGLKTAVKATLGVLPGPSSIVTIGLPLAGCDASSATFDYYTVDPRRIVGGRGVTPGQGAYTQTRSTNDDYRQDTPFFLSRHHTVLDTRPKHRLNAFYAPVSDSNGGETSARLRALRRRDN